MKVTPFRHYPEPAYPTKNRVEALPELLERLPARWRENPFVLATLAAAPLLGGCPGEQGGPGTATAATAGPPTGAPAPPPKRDPLARVAPIFAHGTGIASSGGVAATRMAFIAEDEAIRIIRDEAAKAGLSFEGPARTIPAVELPVTSEQGSFAARKQQASKGNDKTPTPLTMRGDLELDGTDAKRNVSFEFVSKLDFDAWRGSSHRVSTRSTFDIAGTARVLRDEVDRVAPAGTYAVFYDPMPTFVWVKDELSNRPFDAATRAPVDALRRIGGAKVSTESDGSVIVRRAADTIQFVAGKAEALVNGQPKPLGSAVASREGVLYVPLAAAARLLGAEATWDADKKIVTVRVEGQRYSPTSKLAEVDLGGSVGRAVVAFASADTKAAEQPTLAQSEAELRAQVRDFVAWLRDQGGG